MRIGEERDDYRLGAGRRWGDNMPDSRDEFVNNVRLVKAD